MNGSGPLTPIAALTAAVSAVANVLIAFSVLDWTPEQIGIVNLAIVAVGTLLHTWFNPAVKLFGRKP